MPQTVMLKKLKLNGSMRTSKNFEMYKLVLEKAEETEIKLPTSVGLS